MQVTFDGYRAGRLDCSRINLWHSYQDRFARSPETGKPVVATVPHGTKGELIERDGDGCLVEVGVNGQVVRGWATFYFFKELKEEWDKKQRSNSMS